MGRLSDRIAASLISNGIIEKENREIYAFGIRQGLSLILNLLSTIAVGLLLGMVWESILFLIVYMPLRCYAGGFHAKTPLRCYLYSLLLVAVSLVIARQAGTAVYDQLLTLASVFFIWFMVPVGNDTKPLNPAEKKVYRRRARIIAAGEYAASVFLGLLGAHRISSCISVAIWALCFMLVAEKVRKKIFV